MSVVLCCGVAFLSSCSEAVYLELQNETGQTIYVKDFSKGLIAVRVGAVQLIDIKGWLKIESPELRVYNLISAGERYGYRPTGPFAIAVIVDAKWDLYLAAKQADGTLKRIERQPNGFPIASE